MKVVLEHSNTRKMFIEELLEVLNKVGLIYIALTKLA
jgi:hypothetical protein